MLIQFATCARFISSEGVSRFLLAYITKMAAGIDKQL